MFKIFHKPPIIIYMLFYIKEHLKIELPGIYAPVI